MFTPSYSSMCDQIQTNQWVFGHTLTCDLSLTWLFNKPTTKRIPWLENELNGKYIKHKGIILKLTKNISKIAESFDNLKSVLTFSLT
jgi:hypothetical protein